MSKKFRRLRVYEKSGSSVFKNFLFISLLVDLTLHLMSQQHCPRVCFIINALSRQTKIIIAIDFLETEPVKCHDITENVATFPLVLFEFMSRHWRIVLRHKLLFQFAS